MHAIWTGYISFGMVNIPVKLYSATETNRIKFELLVKDDLSHVQYKKVSSHDGRELSLDEIVKGYKVSSDKYVVLENSDFDKVHQSKSDTMEIICFVQETEIDPIYYSKPYYLEPDKNSSKPYALLRKALHNTHKTGIAKFVMRKKEYLVAIKSIDKVLLVNQLRYRENLRDFDDLNLPDNDLLSKDEIEIAESIVEKLTKKFDPSSYEDTYQKDLMDMIEKKAEGEVLESKGTKVKATKVDDLMSALKASLKDAKKQRGSSKKAKNTSNKKSSKSS
jgi:DNA end-binding protein Ku